jgi:hypothetical protein
MPEAFGLKIITSPPRSRRMRSWLASTLSRSSSSPMLASAGAAPPLSSAASWASRKRCSCAGAVV